LACAGPPDGTDSRVISARVCRCSQRGSSTLFSIGSGPSLLHWMRAVPTASPLALSRHRNTVVPGVWSIASGWAKAWRKSAMWWP
jgi:hypothetical protein